MLCIKFSTFLAMSLRRIAVAALWAFLMQFPAAAQDPTRFEGEIQQFERRDAIHPPPANPILFVGSSSFRVWTNLTGEFPDLPILNRGFGGAHFSDINHYFDRVVRPYHPRLIVVYAGDNDVAAGKPPERVLSDFQEFVRRVRATSTNTEVAMISIKPSPSRLAWLYDQKRANALMCDYARTQKKVSFLQIFSEFLDPMGAPRSEFFLADQLHLNKMGYRVWKRVLGPYLDQTLHPLPPMPPEK